jgi:hypothetical protein
MLVHLLNGAADLLNRASTGLIKTSRRLLRYVERNQRR